MERTPRYCFCSPCGPPWSACPADRYCGLCGRELLAVVPAAALLAPDPPVTTVVYLFAQGDAWTGTLRLRLVGRLGARAQVRWTPRSTPALRITDHRRASPGLLELSLQAPRSKSAAPGWLGRARLTITLHGRAFPLSVEAFGLPDTPPLAWLGLRPGEGQVGTVLVFPRAARHVQTFLHVQASPGVPIQLDAVHCDHPAVTVALLHPGRARAPALAEVRWDPARLLAERAEVVFRIRAIGLPEVMLRQRVRRELARPVRFQPAALVVDCLAEDSPQTRLVRLTNVDSRPVVIQTAEPAADWLAGASLAEALPLRLAPGDSTTLHVDLHLHKVNGLSPPYGSVVTLALAGRGRQLYPVRVESVRTPRRCAGPLLLDPGPPRVVLARWDEKRRRPIYLPCSGDGGIEPDALGLDRSAYAAAVHGLSPPHAVLTYLVSAARARCRLRDLLDFTAVRLFAHPWVPADFAAPAVERCDWAAAVVGRHGPAPALLRMDLWDAYFLDSPGRAPLPLLRGAEGTASAGAALVRGFAQHFAEGLKNQGLRVPPALAAAAAGQAASGSAWLRLACESLVLDCAWQPRYAWQCLHRAAWEAVPELGQVPLNLSAAQRLLVRAVADYAQQVAMALVRLGAAEGLAVLGPLSGSALLRGVLRSILASAGFAAEFLTPAWLEWLAPAEAEGERGGPLIFNL